jgi:hypothetical protein
MTYVRMNVSLISQLTTLHGIVLRDGQRCWLLNYVCHLSYTVNRVRSCGLDASGSGYGPVAGFCIRGNKLSGFIKGGEFLD